MTTTDLPTSPAEDATAIAVQTVELQQPGALSLYHLADDLLSLLALREDMAENKEGTEDVDGAIAEYMQALPTKVDAVAHVITTLDSQAELAAREVQRVAARRRRIASAAERLRSYVRDVLMRLPQPKRGSRKLEGSTATLVLKGNGGQQRLDAPNEELVPDEYCTATVTMPWHDWQAILYFCERQDWPLPADYKVVRAVDEDAVRKALAAGCWVCEGTGEGHEHGTNPDGSAMVGQCPDCRGSGKNGVPGARLLERGFHLEIR